MLILSERTTHPVIPLFDGGLVGGGVGVVGKGAFQVGLVPLPQVGVGTGAFQVGLEPQLGFQPPPHVGLEFGFPPLL